MSAGVDVPLALARAAAETVVALLAPGCIRIEVAGSVRRRRPVVHDIEVVAIPRIDQRPVGLLEDVTEPVNMLEELLVAHLDEGLRFSPRQVENRRRDGSIDVQQKLGDAFKALVFDAIPLDLFITDVERWGCIFALRTGPGDWNVRLVMDCKAIGRRVEGGRVVAWNSPTNSWLPVPTEDEESFFRALGQPWVEPWERRVERVRIDRAIAEVPA